MVTQIIEKNIESAKEDDSKDATIKHLAVMKYQLERESGESADTAPVTLQTEQEIKSIINHVFLPSNHILIRNNY